MKQAIETIKRLMQGRSEAFVFGFYIQVALLFTLAWTKPDVDWAGFAIALGVPNGVFYGVSGWVNHSKRKFSNGSSAQSSG